MLRQCNFKCFQRAKRKRTIMVKKKNYYKKYGTFSGESNPFNVKVNRKKHAVLGSDVKGTKGLPGISKGINYAKRKEFFKKNKIATQKSNTYIDKRTMNPNVSFEDSVTARFVQERQKKSKKSVFNLNGEENLTQKEKPFQDSKAFGKVRLGSDDSDEEDNLETSLTTKAVQFGGFSTANSNSTAPKTHKEIIEEMIADSKQKKMERKMEKEKYLSTLEQVDNAWREIHLMSSKPNQSKNTSKIITREPVESNTKDPYDISKYELKFEHKCSSISHTKSAEEITEEEQKTCIQLKKEKLSRMNDNRDSSNTTIYNHISADAICDEYEYLEPITVEDKYEVLDKTNDSGDESGDSQYSSEEMDEDENDPEAENESFTQGDVLMPDMPNNINDFKARVKDCDAEQLGAALKNILKMSVKSKNEKVLNKLEKLFDILLQYAFALCEKKFPKFELIGALPPHLHAIANATNLGTAQRFHKYLDEEYHIFTAFKKRRMKRNFPRPQAIILLKYATYIYSTSDFRHSVVTPAMIFMCDILGSPFCFTFVNILSRLLISELILDCIVDSKRFVPEVVHFLNNVLLLAVPAKSKGKKNLSSPKLFDLIITEEVSSEIPMLDLFSSNTDLTIESKKVGIIFTIANQLLQYATLYSQLPSFKEIFVPTLTVCAQLPVNFYPVALQTQIKKLVELGQKSAPLHQLSFQKAKPKLLKMFEPAFESKFNQKNDINNKREQIKKVAQKIKKEEKSMLREIRRNAQVAAAEKMKEKLELDAERKRKVKEIYGNLAVQEGEFKKMMKKKS